MSIYVEIRDLKSLEKPLLKELRRYTFGSDGWMSGCVTQILRGYRVEEDWSLSDGYEWICKREKLPLVYSEGSALIARNEDGDIMGWALVRHPKKRSTIKRFEWVNREREPKWLGRYWYAGRRPDFMVFVREKYRKRNVARSLLIVAFNNFGKLDVYPHDEPSEFFYNKNARFVVQHNTKNLRSGQYKAREVRA